MACASYPVEGSGRQSSRCGENRESRLSAAAAMECDCRAQSTTRMMGRTNVLPNPLQSPRPFSWRHRTRPIMPSTTSILSAFGVTRGKRTDEVWPHGPRIEIDARHIRSQRHDKRDRYNRDSFCRSNLNTECCAVRAKVPASLWSCRCPKPERRQSSLSSRVLFPARSERVLLTAPSPPSRRASRARQRNGTHFSDHNYHERDGRPRLLNFRLGFLAGCFEHFLLPVVALQTKAIGSSLERPAAMSREAISPICFIAIYMTMTEEPLDMLLQSIWSGERDRSRHAL